MTWTWIEVLWSLANVLGIVANLLLLGIVARKRAAVLASGGRPDSPRILAARRYARNDLGRVLCHAIGLALGVWSLVVPVGDLLLSAVAGWGLLAIMTILLILGIYDLLDERRLDRALAREQEMGVRHD